MAKKQQSDPPKDEVSEPIEEVVDETSPTESFSVEPELKLQIPGAKRPPKLDLDKSMVWIYGEPKIGKTTFASHFPGAWFWATEPGQDFVEVREPTSINSWEELLALCAFIEDKRPSTFGDGEPIKTIVIDTVDLLFKMCQEDVCHQLGVEDPSELPHGKGWARLSNEFERVMTKIRRWPFGQVVISHARQREFKTKGRKVDRWEPAMGAAGYRLCWGLSDLIAYAHTDEIVVKDDEGNVTGEVREDRVLLCHPTSWAVAGGRMSQYLPGVMPLSYSALVAQLARAGKE